MTAQPVTAVDLTNCDREPIHVPGSIQPHGALIGFGPDRRAVLASANAEALLGIANAELTLDQLAGAQGARRLQQQAGNGDQVTGPTPVTTPNGEFEATAHHSDGLLIVELEPAATEPSASFELMRGVILRLSSAASVADLCAIAAREVRSLTGFDRVMVYRFDDDYNGEVVAEERRSDLNPFLGLHYPATDIPAQARALYLANWLRTIVDVGYEPSPLQPQTNPLNGAPVDLSHAVLRSVSPIHVEYLTNMGVAASMSISLIDEGRLWGLIACHHYAGPHRPAQATRAAAEFIGQVMSLLLAAKERADNYQRTIAVQSMLATLVGGMQVERPGEVTASHPAELLDLVDATGMALRLDGRWWTAGTTPDADLDEIAAVMTSQDADVTSTSSLGLDDPRFASCKDVASGVLAVAVSRQSGDTALWFRPEVVQTVDWGGDPQNKVIAVAEDDTVRLSPRRSFDLWKETVRLRSVPWTPLDHDAAGDFGRHVAGLLLQRAQRAAEVARTLQSGLAPEALGTLPGFRVAGRYRAGGLGDVGGDWYDVLQIPGDGTAVVIGDVAGHGVTAATTMGHLRHAARAYLLDDQSPAAVLRRLNALSHWVLPDQVATAIVVVFPSDGSGTMVMASAGHVPPLLSAGGAAWFAEIPAAPALGVVPGAAYSERRLRFDHEVLLLYTDGLVERRGEAIDVSLARLAQASAAHHDDPDLVDRLIELVGPSPAEDDLAVLAVRRG
ncbi:MAG TPA: SpoIIE family protein phosphatase [Egibacteraceae bacterium]|nr:SpoIIE family protein phosphatase [Egibacteraceae bacterium]